MYTKIHQSMQCRENFDFMAPAAQDGPFLLGGRLGKPSPVLCDQRLSGWALEIYTAIVHKFLTVFMLYSFTRGHFCTRVLCKET